MFGDAARTVKHKFYRIANFQHLKHGDNLNCLCSGLNILSFSFVALIIEVHPFTKATESKETSCILRRSQICELGK
jgi:uncharacterized protein YsxB (DUF464 family)